MTVLDSGQRYLRLDEGEGQETINVAEGVTFVATANVGNEYTSTRVMDKALMDRFIIVEMDVLTADEEHGLLNYMFPHVDSDLLKSVAEIASSTRNESKSEAGRLSSGISTRTSVEIAGLLFDGFGLDEAAEVTVYPQFSDDGGLESERTYVKQLVQKYVSDGSSEDLFNEDEISDADYGTLILPSYETIDDEGGEQDTDDSDTDDSSETDDSPTMYTLELTLEAVIDGSTVDLPYSTSDGQGTDLDASWLINGQPVNSYYYSEEFEAGTSVEVEVVVDSYPSAEYGFNGWAFPDTASQVQNNPRTFIMNNDKSKTAQVGIAF